MIRVVGSYLWIGGFRAVDLAEKFGTPLYVYDEETMVNNYGSLRAAFPYRDLEILYSAKANDNAEILRIFNSLGSGLDVVSPWEAMLGLRVGFPPEKILFTGVNVTLEEMRVIKDLGILINIDSIPQLRRYGREFPGTEISIRINPGIGAGVHEGTITGGLTKFGITIDQLGEALGIARNYRLKIVGLHMHIGSGILSVEPIIKATKILLGIAMKIPGLQFIDIGGGLGVPYAPGDKPLDIGRLGEELSALMEDFSSRYGHSIKLRIEPGRYLVANAGVLLTRVVDIKEVIVSGVRKVFVGTDTGMNHLIRPMLYGAYHEIVPVTKADWDRNVVVDVVGNICESTDVIARDRPMPPLEEGDVLAIMNAGAYGYSMSSNYNLRPRPAEILVSRDRVRLIRRRETFNDLIATMVM